MDRRGRGQEPKTERHNTEYLFAILQSTFMLTMWGLVLAQHSQQVSIKK